MGLFGQMAANKAAGAAAQQIIVTQLKKGKSDIQCNCIDFFFSPEVPEKKGCGCFKSNSGMTFKEYLDHVQKMVDGLNLKQRAIEKIGLDESQISEIPPVVLASFLRPDNGVLSKISEDRTMYVTSRYQVTWIFFSATQLYTYNYQFDTTNDNSRETTRDFFYKDITCIRTEHEIEETFYTEKAGCGCLKKQEAKVVRGHNHWDTLMITVPNDSYSFCCKTTDTLEQSIQAAKAMIREKKQA